MPVLNEEAEAVLRRAKVALFATRSPKDRPFMTPLWFVRDDGALYLFTGAQSWAVRNATRHPEVTLLFGGERGMTSGRVLRLRGQATCGRGMPSWRVLARLAAKYYLAPRALLVELRHIRQQRLRRRYHGQTPGGGAYIKVEPTSAQFLRQP